MLDNVGHLISGNRKKLGILAPGKLIERDSAECTDNEYSETNLYYFSRDSTLNLAL